MNPHGRATGRSGLVSSSALLLIVGGVLVLFLIHRGSNGWLASRHTAVREHLYGPEELYEPVTADQEEAEAHSEDQGGDGTEPDDGFDYGSFATGPPSSQEAGRPFAIPAGTKATPIGPAVVACCRAGGALNRVTGLYAPANRCASGTARQSLWCRCSGRKTVDGTS